MPTFRFSFFAANGLCTLDAFCGCWFKFRFGFLCRPAWSPEFAGPRFLFSVFLSVVWPDSCCWLIACSCWWFRFLLRVWWSLLKPPEFWFKLLSCFRNPGLCCTLGTFVVVLLMPFCAFWLLPLSLDSSTPSPLMWTLYSGPPAFAPSLNSGFFSWKKEKF